MGIIKTLRYRNILLFGSLQFCGNIVEYFSENTEKLVVYYLMPRKGREPNMVRLFLQGNVKEEKVFYSPSTFLLCYIVLYGNFVWILFRYFSRNEKFFVICGHPLFSFFKSILRLFRQYKIVYFVGDYYPRRSLVNVIYQTVSHYYHDRACYRTYISDRLNKKYNRKVINTRNVKTVMWGINPSVYRDKDPRRALQLCFIGAIRPSHGLLLALELLKEKKDMKIKVLGTCEESLFKEYKKVIQKWGIEKQVYFPNRFILQLEEEAGNCHIGVALYTLNEGTYYADPGKVKAYAQLGLPIIMTDAAEVAEYIKKFKAGEIVTSQKSSILQAILSIQENYPTYIQGLKKFNAYFNYKTYYPPRFAFLEQ